MSTNWERSRHAPVCVVCGEKAITTAVHIPVCDRHYQEYCREGEQYPTYRPVYDRLVELHVLSKNNNL